MWQEAPSTLQLGRWGPRRPCPEISRRPLGEKLLEDRRGADLCDLGVGNGHFQVIEKVNFEKKQGVPGGSGVKNLPAMQETRVQSLIWEDPTSLRAASPMRHNY